MPSYAVFDPTYNDEYSLLGRGEKERPLPGHLAPVLSRRGEVDVSQVDRRLRGPIVLSSNSTHCKIRQINVLIVLSIYLSIRSFGFCRTHNLVHLLLFQDVIVVMFRSILHKMHLYFMRGSTRNQNWNSQRITLHYICIIILSPTCKIKSD